MKKLIYIVVIIGIILLAIYIFNYESNKNIVSVGGSLSANTLQSLSSSSVSVTVNYGEESSVESDINKNNSNKKMDTETASKIGNTLTVNYVGTLEDGTKFDSSIDRGVPFTFVVGIGQVIRGWDEGMLGMKVGEKKHLVIPGEKAYGPRGIPDGKGGYMIPPNATLIFDVEMLKIESK